MLQMPKDKVEDVAVKRLTNPESGLMGKWVKARENCLRVPLILQVSSN